MYIQTDGKRVQNLIGHCLNGTCEPMQKKYVHTFLKACPRGLKVECPATMEKTTVFKAGTDYISEAVRV